MSKRERKDTRIHLAAELEAMNTGSMAGCPWLLGMIKLAKAGEYHDYKNKLFTCGKVAVIEHLQRLKTPAATALAKRVMDGEFDEEADEEDKVELRKMLHDNGMGGKGFKEIFGL